ncbi:MAG: hypothetical protein AABX85_02930 [Nanoarchaeota archaeon]
MRENWMIDIDDGGLLEFMPSFLEYYNRRNGTHFVKQDIFSYDLWKSFGITEEKAVTEIQKFYQSPGFNRLPTFPGAIELLCHLSKYGSSVFAVTARPSHVDVLTKDNLRFNFGEYAPEVIFSRPYTPLLDGNGKLKTKVEICLERNIGFATEDSVKQANTLGEAGIIAFLLPQPWNLNEIKIHSKVIRVNSLRDVVEKKRLFISE